MPKRSKQQIAQDEKKILAELQHSANESIDTIAKHCKFSRQKVWRRNKRLQETNTIWGYTAILDDTHLNQKHYVALIKKTPLPLNEKTTTTASTPYLQTLAEPEGITIENSFYVHGEHDWIVTFTAPDIKTAKRFCEHINSAFAGHIAKITLEETLFWIRKQHILNPEAKKLKDFVF